jgi:hypothetical protein
MNKDRKPDKQPNQMRDLKHREPKISRALRAMAKSDVKEFKSQSDKAFLTRAEMEKKLTSL